MGNRVRYVENTSKTSSSDKFLRDQIARLTKELEAQKVVNRKLLLKNTDSSTPNHTEPKTHTIAGASLAATAPKLLSKNEEYELKFLVDDTLFWYIDQNCYARIRKEQGYIKLNDNAFSQVRISKRHDRDYGLVTLKTTRDGAHRTEYQYRIPALEAQEMIDKCELKIQKYRLCIRDQQGLEWEVDHFVGKNNGLLLAEIEFDRKEDLETFRKEGKVPYWVTTEVTDDPRYYNDYLAAHPWPTWTTEEKQKGGLLEWLSNMWCPKI